MDGGTLNLKGGEGIESTYVLINDGKINIQATDDGINAASKSSAYNTPSIEINGGEITISMGQGDTDAIDSNGNITINGGKIDITAGMSSFDCDGKATYNGGTIIINGTQVDSRMYPDLQAMYDAMKAIGLCPYTREGYRTYTDQQEIMDNRIATHLAEGYSYEGALEQAEKYVAIPGTSEHQLGLAVDINAYDGNDYGVYSWLADHAYEYGFILRYPQGKEYTTGYEYEPWHYRYVGKTAASYIYWNDITLEDYLGMY